MSERLVLADQPTSWQGLRGSAFEVALAALCFLVCVVAVASLGQALAAPTALVLLMTPIATGLAALAYRYLAPTLSGSTLAQAPPLEPAGLKDSALVALMGVAAAMVGSMAIAWVSQHLLGHEVQEQARIVALFERGDPFELAALGVAVTVLAPLAEEWLFRGLLFRRLGLWTNLGWALALSGLLFAGVHGNLSGVATYLWLAACFTFALVRSGRLGCAVFVHAANNAATFVLLFVGQQS